MVVTLRQFVKDFQAAVAQTVGQSSLQLGKGQCKDFEEYKRKVGFIEGLNAAADLADQMMRRVEDADFDDGLGDGKKAGGGKGK